MEQGGGADTGPVGEFARGDAVEAVLGKRIERNLEQDPASFVAVV